MKLVTVSRHFSGLRHPAPNMVMRYEEYTEGAVKAEDWVSLWNEPSAIAAREKEEAARLAREERSAAFPPPDDAASPVAATG